MTCLYLRTTVLAGLLAATPVWSATTELDACASGCLNPAVAVVLAIRAAPRTMEPVKVLMTVKGADVEESSEGEARYYYLNSEEDYRSQISVNLKIKPNVANQLSEGFGIEGVRRTFMNRRIVVKGVPTRVKIFFLCKGKPTAAYYYQTHLNVDTADQITIVEHTVPQTSSTNLP